MVCNGVSSHESNHKVSADKISNGIEETTAADVSKLGKRPSLPSVDVKQRQGLNPGPTPAPTPTVASGASFEARDSGVYSSASDPVLVPSLNPRNPNAVGAIKREIGSQRTAADSVGTSLPETRLNASQDVANNNQVAQRTMISANKTSQDIERSQKSEASRPSSAMSQKKSSTSISNQDSWSAQQVNGDSKCKFRSYIVSCTFCLGVFSKACSRANMVLLLNNFNCFHRLTPFVISIVKEFMTLWKLCISLHINYHKLYHRKKRKRIKFWTKS